MEYIVSNVEISGAHGFHPIYGSRGISGNKKAVLYLLEGYIVDYHIKDVVEYCRQGTPGRIMPTGSLQ